MTNYSLFVLVRLLAMLLAIFLSLGAVFLVLRAIGEALAPGMGTLA